MLQKIQMQYSLLLDLQGDSDEDKFNENTDLNVELPDSEDSAHFKRFEIKCRDKESKEEVKTVLNSLEKEPMLLSLIPLAFNKDLEGESQAFSLLVEKDCSL